MADYDSLILTGKPISSSYLKLVEHTGSQLVGADGNVFQDFNTLVTTASLSASFSRSMYIPISGSIIAEIPASPYSPPHQEGLLFWDKENHTYAIYGDSPNTTLQIGQENWVRVLAGENIANGTAVYISGSISQIPVAYLAIADGTQTKNLVIGAATHDISSGSQGWITTTGLVHDVDTSAWGEGSVLYLSPTVSGSYVTSAPREPFEKVIVGRCSSQDAVNGHIFVGITIIPELPVINVGMVQIPTISTSSLTPTGSVVTIGSGNVNLCTTSDGLGVIRNYGIPSANFALTSSFLDAQYIVATHISNSAVYRMDSDKSSVDNIQTVLVYTLLMGAGGVVSYTDWDSPGILLANKNLQRVQALRAIEREIGFDLSESGSRGIYISSGSAWQGVTRLSRPTVRSGVDRIILVAHSASLWSGSLISQFVNNYYDNGTNLALLSGGNHWTVNWVYRAIGNQNSSLILLGGDYTKLTDAVASQPPAPPTELPDVAFLVGRAIYQSGASTATQVDSAYVQSFVPAGITIHNNLDGLQGGSANEYYHLNSASYSNIITNHSSSWASSSLSSSWVSGLSGVGLTATRSFIDSGSFLHEIHIINGLINSWGSSSI